MLEQKVREYFENEYNITKNTIKNYVFESTKQDYTWYALQRCLGVAQFVQGLGDDFTNIEPLYEEYKKSLKNSLDKRHDMCYT